MLFLLALACSPEPEPPRARGSDTDAHADTAPGDSGEDCGVGGPGDWPDPITWAADLDVALPGVEITDSDRDGDLLMMAGQQQGGEGGLWRYDISDPDAPRLTGKSQIWHIQRVCLDGQGAAWGTEREGRIVHFDVGGDTPQPGDRRAGGGWDYGIDCDGTRVAWGEGNEGGFVGLAEGSAINAIQPIDGNVQDVMLDGDLLWAVAQDGLRGWDISSETPVALGAVDLPGQCSDIAPVGDMLAVACGSTGVHLVAPGDGTPTLVGSWRGHASARRVSAAGPDQVAVAAWGELVILDITDPTAPTMVAAESARSAVMTVVGDGPGRVFVGEWNAPYVAHIDPAPAPEVRATSRHALAGGTVRIINDGTAALSLGTPSAGAISAAVVLPGGEARWSLPEDLSGGASLPTDDPDEPTVELLPAGLDGPVIGEAAPAFIESDLEGTVWDLSALAGQVVFLAMIQDGCPTCSSEVPAVEATLQNAFGDGEGGSVQDFVRLWVFDGQEARARAWATEYGIASPVLVDADHTLRVDYFVPNGDGAFAANPRHYLIDRDGRLVWLSTTVEPGSMVAAIEDTLGGE